jgi:hypothetical protein
MAITTEDWEKLQIQLGRIRKDAEASMHEAMAALIRDDYGAAIKHLGSAQTGLSRLHSERHSFY